MCSGERWHPTIAIPATGRSVRRPMDCATVAAIRQGLKAWMLPDLVVELNVRGGVALTVAEMILSTIRAHIGRA
jgi:hypothetical protein